MTVPNNFLEMNQQFADKVRVYECTGVPIENWYTAFGYDGALALFGLITGRLDAVGFVTVMQSARPHLETELIRCLLNAFIIGA